MKLFSDPPCTILSISCVGIAEFAGVEFAGLENDGLENDGVEQEQTYAFKVKPVLFEGTV